MTISYEEREAIAYVTLDRPEKANALTPEMMEAGGEAITKADRRDHIRCIVITGAGDEAFCAGADLAETIPAITSGDYSLAVDDPERDILLRRSRVTTPIVAAINGYCLAGGLELVQATDIRVAAEHATFGLPEVQWGLTPSGGSHVRLPRQLPYAFAMELLLTGESIDAETAARRGLVNCVVERGTALETAEEYATRIVRNGPVAVEKIKEAVVRCAGLPLDQAFSLETAIGREVFRTEDAKEGPRAFVEGRDPEFIGE